MYAVQRLAHVGVVRGSVVALNEQERHARDAQVEPHTSCSLENRDEECPVEHLKYSVRSIFAGSMLIFVSAPDTIDPAATLLPESAVLLDPRNPREAQPSFSACVLCRSRPCATST